MDKEVAVKVKDHKRKHDSDDEEDDDDNEGPSAGSNQGRSAKKRRPESAASGRQSGMFPEIPFTVSKKRSLISSKKLSIQTLTPAELMRTADIIESSPPMKQENDQETT
ncbi:hypothetical protein Tco_0455545 [Tanacetum coccineum]